jgi:hypothetical protein
VYARKRSHPLRHRIRYRPALAVGAGNTPAAVHRTRGAGRTGVPAAAGARTGALAAAVHRIRAGVRIGVPAAAGVHKPAAARARAIATALAFAVAAEAHPMPGACKRVVTSVPFLLTVGFRIVPPVKLLSMPRHQYRALIVARRAISSHPGIT